MLETLVRTRRRWDLAVARLVLGAVFLPHGLQKLFGWFGGFGFAGTMAFLTDSLGIPWILGLLVVVAESVGALCLIAGVLGRFFSFVLAVDMVVAALLVHLPNGFFMNWYGTQAGEGFEFHLLAVGLAIVVMIGGSGAASVDRVLTSRSARADGPAEGLD